MLGASSHVGVRAARRTDADALVSVFDDSWRHAYTGIIPHLHLDLMIRRRTAAWWRRVIAAGESVTVLEVAGKIVGYATYGPARHGGKHEGEIYELYISPIHQGLGFGELLFESCRYELDQRSLNGLILWALTDNTSAVDFYWRRGGRPIASTIDRIGRARLEKVALAWS